MTGSARVSVVKVGGSLIGDAPRMRVLLTGLAEGQDGPAVIVPGGGPFAEAVRTAQGALGFGDPLAHRLALDAMGRMAEVFSDIEPRLGIVRSVEAAAGTLSRGETCLWDPVALQAGHPAIPESWDVTSDSLALWLATALGSGRCVLVKSAPCPPGVSPRELALLGLVDRAFPAFASVFAGEIVLHGSDGEITLPRSAEHLSSHPRPHPEVRGEAEPRRSSPDRSGTAGALLRGPLARAPQDEGEGGMAAKARQRSRGSAAV